MKSTLFSELAETMAGYGFREVADAPRSIQGVELLLKRQTLNTNRAIVGVNLPEPPPDFESYLRQLRNCVAFQCRFFPFFWGIGIQVVVVAPGFAETSIDPAQHVARVDNQWAIVQSIFLVDPSAKAFRGDRTWGQVVTGKFQDAIAAVLARHFKAQSPWPSWAVDRLRR